MGAQRRRLVAHVEECFAVGGEDKIGRRIVDAFIDDLAGRDGAHKDAKFTVTVEIDRECDARVVRAYGPRAELILVRMAGSERADVEHALLFRPRPILAAHDEWILRALREAALIDIAVVGRGDARILLRRARFQFRGKFIN
jgi:hypothetical protein